MFVKDLIKELKKMNQELPVLVASDEEWNNLYSDVEIGVEEKIINQKSTGDRVVLFGLSGSEVE